MFVDFRSSVGEFYKLAGSIRKRFLAGAGVPRQGPDRAGHDPGNRRPGCRRKYGHSAGKISADMGFAPGELKLK